MEMAIAARVDGIIVQVSDEEAVSVQIDKAEEQNIPVITIAVMHRTVKGYHL